MEHLYVKFGDPWLKRFWGIVQKNRQTNKRRWEPYPATAVGVQGNNQEFKNIAIEA